MIAAIIITALILDTVFAEPRRYHPLIGFGKCARFIEALLNTQAKPFASFLSGILALIILLSLTLLCVLFFKQYLNQQNYSIFITFVFDSLIVYFAIAHKSLQQHVYQIYTALLNNNIEQARNNLSLIVSRDTSQLNPQQITHGAIESTLENGNDAIFGVIFWYCFLGSPAVLIYRLVNTLDAMWGYRTPRFNYFGRSAARLDDVLNYIPARLVAVSYAFLGNTLLAFKCWQQQAHLLASPNAGPVMCAGAGSLDVQLGGPAYYHSSLYDKPFFGSHRPAKLDDISAALRLIKHTLILWCALLAAYGFFNFIFLLF